MATAANRDVEPTPLAPASMIRATTIPLGNGDEFAALDVCLDEVAAIVHATWRNAVGLTVEVAPNLPLVMCDGLALQAAILNLLLNARDALPEGGCVLVRAEATVPDSGFTGVEVRVTDTGIGMKPDTVERAFDAFFTTKADGLGGVGLTLVRRFAEDSGGRVLIESTFGFGTSVRLQLPAYTQHVPT